jgi:hypothetical protein
LEGLNVGGVILKSYLKKEEEGCILDSSDSERGLVASRCDNGTEISGSTKCGEILQCLKCC